MNPKEIKEWRKECGLTQEAAAEYIGVTRAAWQHWEYGRIGVPKPVRKLLRLLKQELAQ